MDTSHVVWFKSSHSGQNGECLEACHSVRGTAVRDSKQADGPVIGFTTAAWAAFVAQVKGEVA